MATSTEDSSKLDNSFSMKMVIKGLKVSWPSVKTIETTTLFTWLFSDPSENRKVLLLDARPEEEYVVSHLDGAIKVDPDGNDVKSIMENIFEGNMKGSTDVVCYCSIGYRSSQYAHLLSRLMIKEAESYNANPPNVYNLEGSLFKWANEGKPIIDNNGKTTIFVHPYNSVWGKLLESSKRKHKPN